MGTTAARTLGERLRELRDARDLSLRELGKLLGGKSAAFLSDVELGRRYPSEDLLVEMARVLKTPLEDLKKYDSRAPVDELRKLATANPAYGLALRRVIDMNVSPEDLMRLAERKRDR